ncbi:MAG: hypothetical protein LPK19_11455 [Hymenobacteraceae bacterium]|nr:hypothetical protein [Hymenobacteraceae bacterium]MDX5396842.1 hypothetical protein [Hymenobacteraceae bacterium]MDX5512913.1 hypothetical protein [Hymenobacteraceae bacterium]
MKQKIYKKFTWLFSLVVISMLPAMSVAQSGAESVEELGRNLHQAIKANNPTILTRYYPSEAVLDQVRRTGSKDLQELLKDATEKQLAASFEADFKDLMKLDIADEYYLSKTTVKETDPVQLKLKEGVLMPTELRLEDKQGRQFSIYYQVLRLDNRFYYFRNMRLERIGYKYRPDAATAKSNPVKGKIIRGAATIPELGFALFTALKAQDASTLNLYIPEKLEMDYLRQKGTGPAKAVTDSVTADELAKAIKRDFQRVIEEGRSRNINWSQVGLKEVEVVLPSIKDGSMKVLRVIVQEPNGKEMGVVFESIKTQDRHYLFRNMRISTGNAPW